MCSDKLQVVGQACCQMGIGLVLDMPQEAVFLCSKLHQGDESLRPQALPLPMGPSADAICINDDLGEVLQLFKVGATPLCKKDCCRAPWHEFTGSKVSFAALYLQVTSVYMGHPG